jgi:CheY-like chemotaxis protein
MPTILVVDDDDGCRKLTAKILGLQGFDTLCAADGLEALGVLRRSRVNLILLDLMMPVMDGMTFLKVMRAEAAWANLPVIVLSGIADMELGRAVRESGVETYLVKSRYTIEDLLQHIEREIAGRPDPQLNVNAISPVRP